MLEAGLIFLESLGPGDAGRHGDAVDDATTLHRDTALTCTVQAARLEPRYRKIDRVLSRST